MPEAVTLKILGTEYEIEYYPRDKMAFLWDDRNDKASVGTFHSIDEAVEKAMEE